MADRVRLTLLGRTYCHLCDDLLRQLDPLSLEFGVEVDVVDIDHHPQLEHRWGEHVPVLFAGERELLRHRASDQELRVRITQLLAEIR